ncbi:MAG: VanW family protein [Clostridia bacterium]|nr:VanW family protein [Clostridia bacterium]
MKKQIVISMLLTSFLLASCQNNTEENNNIPQEQSNSINDNFSDNSVKGERMTYQDYVEKYNFVTDENNEQPSINTIEENNENITNVEEKNENTNEKESNHILATYSTSLGSSSDERINNLEIVCDRLNDYILKPAETFSYNDVTGPFGPDDGFEEAPILLNDGSESEGYGGGVCQLSSTLYNVVKNIENVDITERHHHSKPVSYVPEGEDATVSLQSGLDFKFVNNTNYPIKFKAKCENNEVTVWAYKVI